MLQRRVRCVYYVIEVDRLLYAFLVMVTLVLVYSSYTVVCLPLTGNKRTVKRKSWRLGKWHKTTLRRTGDEVRRMARRRTGKRHRARPRTVMLRTAKPRKVMRRKATRRTGRPRRAKRTGRACCGLRRRRQGRPIETTVLQTVRRRRQSRRSKWRRRVQRKIPMNDGNKTN